MRPSGPNEGSPTIASIYYVESRRYSNLMKVKKKMISVTLKVGIIIRPPADGILRAVGSWSMETAQDRWSVHSSW